MAIESLSQSLTSSLNHPTVQRTKSQNCYRVSTYFCVSWFYFYFIIILFYFILELLEHLELFKTIPHTCSSISHFWWYGEAVIRNNFIKLQEIFDTRENVQNFCQCTWDSAYWIAFTVLHNTVRCACAIIYGRLMFAPYPNDIFMVWFIQGGSKYRRVSSNGISRDQIAGLVLKVPLYCTLRYRRLRQTRSAKTTAITA